MLRTAEIPLQYNLFTGELVDNRTAEQKRRDNELCIPTQILMFSQRDIAQIGVSAHPRMDLSPGRLHLISEDPRTEEEIERDRLRQAQSLTAELFPQSVSIISEPTQAVSPLPPTEILFSISPPSESLDPLEESEIEYEALPSVDPHVTKYVAYQELVRLAEERAATLAISPVSALAETISMSLAKFQAQQAGLTSTEIATALLIGNFRGKQEIQTPPLPPKVAPDKKEPSHKRSWDVPILWLNRTDLLKRRPDLVDKIEELSEYEVEAIAALVGQALEEFYWIQMNVVLSLYLELQLHLRVPTSKQTGS